MAQRLELAHAPLADQARTMQAECRRITWAIEQTRRSADAIMAERREQLRLSGCH
jgi:hypothetical protein